MDRLHHKLRSLHHGDRDEHGGRRFSRRWRSDLDHLCDCRLCRLAHVQSSRKSGCAQDCLDCGEHNNLLHGLPLRHPDRFFHALYSWNLHNWNDGNIDHLVKALHLRHADNLVQRHRHGIGLDRLPHNLRSLHGSRDETGTAQDSRLSGFR